MIILMQMLTLKGPFCRVHGVAAVKRMTGRSLLLGWWGLISFVVMNPITLILNFVAWMRLRRLAGPVAVGHAPTASYGPSQQAYSAVPNRPPDTGPGGPHYVA